jgi:hypothetical protein
LNTKTQQLISVVTTQHQGFTLSPAVDWKTGNKTVSVSHKFRAGTLKGSYAHEKQLASLNYDFKPFNVRSSPSCRHPPFQSHPVCVLPDGFNSPEVQNLSA